MLTLSQLSLLEPQRHQRSKTPRSDNKSPSDRASGKSKNLDSLMQLASGEIAADQSLFQGFR